MEYELFCVRICKGCAIRAMLLTAKGFQKVLNQFPFLIPQSCRIFTIVLRCIEKFKVHIMNLWTSSCPGPNTVFFWGCLFAAYRMFSIAVIHSFWPKLVLQMAGRPHPHVILTSPRLNRIPKWFPCPINPIILRHEPTSENQLRAELPWRIEKVSMFYPCLIGKSSTAMVTFPGELLTYQRGHFLGLPEALASSFSVVAWSQTHIWTQISSPIWRCILTGILTVRVRGEWWYYIKSGGKCRRRA